MTFGSQREHRFALFGGDPYSPDAWAEPVLRFALFHAASGDGSVAVLLGAAGDESTSERTVTGARTFLARLGIPARIVRLRARGDASDPAIIRDIERASVIHLCDGDARALVRGLAGSRLHEAILGALDRGAVLAADGAGARAAGGFVAYDPATAGWGPGLGFLPETAIVPAWAGEPIAEPTGAWLVALPARAALVTDGARWRTFGGKGVRVAHGERTADVRPGTTFTADELASLLRPLVRLPEGGRVASAATRITRAQPAPGTRRSTPAPARLAHTRAQNVALPPTGGPAREPSPAPRV